MDCQITQQVFEIMDMLQEERKKPKDYGTGMLLYHSEVAFLDIIGQNSQANVSRISELLEITKGAVTQMSAKLSQKGLIEIYLRAGNKKEKYFRLTPKGEETRTGHRQFHDRANRNLCDYFRSLSAHEVQVVFDFLHQLKQSTPFCEFTCRCVQSAGEKEEQGKSGAVQDAESACRTKISR